MKKLSLLLLVIVLVFPALAAMAQDDNNVFVPAGMEVIQVGGTKVVVPKGSHVRKQADVIILEPPVEYVARNIEDMNGRITELERQVAVLSDKIEQLTKAFEELKKK